MQLRKHQKNFFKNQSINNKRGNTSNKLKKYEYRINT